MSQNLDHAYDQYLKEHPEEAIQAIESFQKRLSQNSFKYGRFTIPSFYKPFFMTSKQHALVKRVTKALHGIVNTALRFYFEESYLRRMFRVNEGMEDLIKIDPGYSQSVVFGRFDGLMEGEGLKFVEFNCDAPAGGAYADILSSSLSQDSFFKDFSEEHSVEASSRAETILDALLSVYEEFGGYENPNIAILDWKNSRTRSEFLYLQKVFEEKGYKTIIADPRDLQYKNGQLYHRDVKIQLAYRRFIVSEMLNHMDELTDFIKAYKDKAVCVVNPLRSCLGSHKALLSILTNPEFDHFFTDSENKIKKDFLPWTRQIQDAVDFFGDKTIYLVDFLKDEKETLILKPKQSDAYRKVAVGCDAPDDEWNEAIDRAIKENWMVQEYVPVPTITVPQVLDQKLDFAYKKFNMSSLSCSGKYALGFSRLSDSNVIRVAEKGGIVPIFWCDQIPERVE